MAVKTVVVTGGNRGLGLKLCQKLVAAGYRVILTSRDAASGATAVKQIESATGKTGSCTVEVLDVSSQDSIDAFVKKLQNDGRHIDVLVNNAGVAKMEWTKDAFDLVYRTNYLGPLLLTTKLADNIITGGRVVMVSSGLGALSNMNDDYRSAVQSAKTVDEVTAIGFKQGSEGVSYGPYSVSKAMLNRATQLLAEDSQIKARELSIIAVCPGWCRTDMGGANATRADDEGAESIFWAVDSADARPGFFRDGAVSCVNV